MLTGYRYESLSYVTYFFIILKEQNNGRIAADCERKKQNKNLKSVLYWLSVGFILRFLSRLAFWENKYILHTANIRIEFSFFWDLKTGCNEPFNAFDTGTPGRWEDLLLICKIHDDFFENTARIIYLSTQSGRDL